jgi:hypothetical protein
MVFGRHQLAIVGLDSSYLPVTVIVSPAATVEITAEAFCFKARIPTGPMFDQRSAAACCRRYSRR